jgi:hypothetical protein
LVETRVEAGKKLLAELDSSGFPVRSAFWNYSDESGWKLVIASRHVRERGLREAYRLVNQALSELGDVDLTVSDVSLVKDDEPFVDLLASAVSTGPQALSQIRFTGNSVRGVFVQDALIYRST